MANIDDSDMNVKTGESQEGLSQRFSEKTNKVESAILASSQKELYLKGSKDESQKGPSTLKTKFGQLSNPYVDRNTDEIRTKPTQNEQKDVSVKGASGKLSRESTNLNIDMKTYTGVAARGLRSGKTYQNANDAAAMRTPEKAFSNCISSPGNNYEFNDVGSKRNMDHLTLDKPRQVGDSRWATRDNLNNVSTTRGRGLIYRKTSRIHYNQSETMPHNRGQVVDDVYSLNSSEPLKSIYSTKRRISLSLIAEKSDNYVSLASNTASRSIGEISQNRSSNTGSTSVTSESHSEKSKSKSIPEIISDEVLDYRSSPFFLCYRPGTPGFIRNNKENLGNQDEEILAPSPRPPTDFTFKETGDKTPLKHSTPEDRNADKTMRNSSKVHLGENLSITRKFFEEYKDKIEGFTSRSEISLISVEQLCLLYERSIKIADYLNLSFRGIKLDRESVETHKEVTTIFAKSGEITLKLRANLDLISSMGELPNEACERLQEEMDSYQRCLHELDARAPRLERRLLNRSAEAVSRQMSTEKEPLKRTKVSKDHRGSSNDSYSSKLSYHAQSLDKSVNKSTPHHETKLDKESQKSSIKSEKSSLKDKSTSDRIADRSEKSSITSAGRISIKSSVQSSLKNPSMPKANASLTSQTSLKSSIKLDEDICKTIEGMDEVENHLSKLPVQVNLLAMVGNTTVEEPLSGLQQRRDHEEKHKSLGYIKNPLNHVLYHHKCETKLLENCLSCIRGKRDVMLLAICMTRYILRHCGWEAHTAQFVDWFTAAEMYHPFSQELITCLDTVDGKKDLVQFALRLSKRLMETKSVSLVEGESLKYLEFMEGMSGQDIGNSYTQTSTKEKGSIKYDKPDSVYRPTSYQAGEDTKNKVSEPHSLQNFIYRAPYFQAGDDMKNKMSEPHSSHNSLTNKNKGRRESQDLPCHWQDPPLQKQNDNPITDNISSRDYHYNNPENTGVYQLNFAQPGHIRNQGQEGDNPIQDYQSLSHRNAGHEPVDHQGNDGNPQIDRRPYFPKQNDRPQGRDDPYDDKGPNDDDETPYKGNPRKDFHGGYGGPSRNNNNGGPNDGRNPNRGNASYNGGPPDNNPPNRGNPHLDFQGNYRGHTQYVYHQSQSGLNNPLYNYPTGQQNHQFIPNPDNYKRKPSGLKFDGKDMEKYTDFKDEFEMYSQNGMWSENDAIDILTKCLEGKAMNVLVRAKLTNRNTIKQYWAALDAYFKHSGDEYTLSAKFQKRIKQADETCKQFLIDLRGLLFQAHPTNRGSAMYEENIRTQFIRGLPAEMREKLQRPHCDPLLEMAEFLDAPKRYITACLASSTPTPTKEIEAIPTPILTVKSENSSLNLVEIEEVEGEEPADEFCLVFENSNGDRQSIRVDRQRFQRGRRRGSSSYRGNQDNSYKNKDGYKPDYKIQQVPRAEPPNTGLSQKPQNNSSGNAQDERRTRPPCGHCKRVGHPTENCFLKKMSDMQSQIDAFNLKESKAKEVGN